MFSYRDEHIYENFNDSRDSGIDNKPEESQNIGPNSKVGFTDIKLNEMHNGEKKEENGAEVTSSLGKKEPFVEIKDAKGKKVQEEKKPSMWLVLAKCFGWTFFLGAILKFFHDVLLFVNPYLLRYAHVLYFSKCNDKLLVTRNNFSNSTIVAENATLYKNSIIIKSGSRANLKEASW